MNMKKGLLRTNGAVFSTVGGEGGRVGVMHIHNMQFVTLVNSYGEPTQMPAHLKVQ
jgi:hypothetical protein